MRIVAIECKPPCDRGTTVTNYIDADNVQYIEHRSSESCNVHFKVGNTKIIWAHAASVMLAIASDSPVLQASDSVR